MSFNINQKSESSLKPESSLAVPPICTFRRALDSDIEEVNLLVSSTLLASFGQVSVEYTIKKCFYSLVALNSEEQIVALICLDDHPNVPALLPAVWEDWVKNLYNLTNITSQNSLWIHLLTCHSDYTYVFLKPLLEQVFITFPLLIHVLTVCPAGFPIFCFMEENFTCIMPVGYRNPRRVQTLYLTLRYHYVKKYKVRLAVEEDNDDIIPLIDSHSERLKEMYGEYYVSEILTKHPEMRRNLIVAEYAERAVAVLFLNEDVNYSAIAKSFSLEYVCNLHVFDKNAFIRRNTLEDISVSGFMDVEQTSQTTVMVEEQERETLGVIIPPHVDEEQDDASFKTPSTDDDEIDLTEVGIVSAELLTTMSDLFREAKEEGDEMVVIKAPSEMDSRKGRSLSLPDNEFMYRARISGQKSRLRLLPDAIETAFTLEIMAAGTEHEETVLCDLLEASFQSFPERNFCIFSVLPTQPHFPLFDYFVKVSPIRSCIYPQELYVLHKNAIKANIIVRNIKKSDVKKIRDIIDHTEMVDCAIDYIENVLQSTTDTKVYVITNIDVIVGFIAVRTERDLEYLLANYNVHEFTDINVHKYDKIGVIDMCIFSPIFHKHTQFFLREVHRLSGMSVLMYMLRKNEISLQTRTMPLPSILRDLIPTRDRHLPLYSRMNLEDIQLPPFLKDRKVDRFALYLSTPRLCSLPRFDINSRLVVIGASNTGLSFLETLIFYFDRTRHIIFNNLNLVYDRIVRDVSGPSKHISAMFVHRGKYSSNHLNSVCFHSHVNCIKGVMTAIDRKNKYITINHDLIVPYDYLFLMCGLQFHHPYSIGLRADKKSQSCPFNIFIINKLRDAEIAFLKLNRLLQNNTKYTIIVYGSKYRAYCCLATLQKLKISNQFIKFVEPYPDEHERPSINVFNNSDIHEALLSILENSGIETYRGYYFFEWEYNAQTNIVSSVKFQSRQGAVTLECDAMFYFANMEVNYNTFIAVNRAGLVYDGKLVIGPDCRTNDPYIFAAGSMTKYSRKYFADRYLHKYYDSHEIGERLAKQVRAMLLPGGLEENRGDPIFDILKNEKMNKLVPRYTRPLVANCILPGNLNYLNICKPGKPIPVEKEMENPDFGYELITGSMKDLRPGEDPKYFRIHIDSYNTVRQITCVTKQDIEVNNLLQIWGKHEKLLNNLVSRHTFGMITDFYAYFREPRFCALYMDTFRQEENYLTDIEQLLTENVGESLIEDITNAFVKKRWKKLSEVEETIIVHRFNNSPYHTLMVEEVMKFLGENYTYLPMYAHPMVTKLILGNLEDSPLFKKAEAN